MDRRRELRLLQEQRLLRLLRKETLVRQLRTQRRRRGTWNIDHSRSLINGGSHNRNNLFPACIDCNHETGARNGKSYKATLVRQGVRDSGPGLSTIVRWGLLGALALGALKKA